MVAILWAFSFSLMPSAVQAVTDPNSVRSSARRAWLCDCTGPFAVRSANSFHSEGASKECANAGRGHVS